MSEASPAEPLIQPRSALITLFGSFVVPLGNWIAVADIVSLLGELNLEGPSVRAAVARVKTAGLLDSAPRETVAGYSASRELVDILDAGDPRIFTSQVPADLADGWVLAVFSVPESKRDQRHRLRSLLTNLGFGPVSSGVWMAPSRTMDDVKRQLQRAGLSSYVHLFGADYAGFESITELIGAAWDPANLIDAYRAFVDRHSSAVDDWVETGREPRLAFVSCIRALEEWRPLAFRDPGLPDEIAPCSVERTRARNLFAKIGERMKQPADGFVASVMGLPDR